MTRTMYDSTNVGDDPLSADLVAYYCDGAYATTVTKVRQRFPSAVLVPISAIGSNAGIVGDQEPGCMSIEQAVGWVQQRRAAGFDPSIYVNEVYGWAGARQAFDAYGVPEPHWWVADYDGRPIIPGGAVAKQFENPPLTGGHFDRSVVADFWPGVDGTFGGSTTHHSTWRRVKKMATSDSFIVFGIGDTDQLYYDRFDNAAGSWTGPKSLGGAISEFDVTGAGQRIDVYARGLSDRQAYHLYSIDAGATFAPWQLLGGTYKAPLVALGPGPTTASAPAPAVDLSSVLGAIADLKAHPSFDPNDAATLAIVTKLETAARAAGAAA